MQNKHVFLISVVLLSSALFFGAQLLEARPFSGNVIQLPLQKIAPGAGQILIDFVLPENHEFVHDAPSSIRARIKDAAVFQTALPQNKMTPLDFLKLPYVVNYQASAGKTVVVMDIRANFCNKDVRICLTESVRVKIPVEIQAGAASAINVQIPLCTKVVVCPDSKS